MPQLPSTTNKSPKPLVTLNCWRNWTRTEISVFKTPSATSSTTCRKWWAPSPDAVAVSQPNSATLSTINWRQHQFQTQPSKCLPFGTCSPPRPWLVRVFTASGTLKVMVWRVLRNHPSHAVLVVSSWKWWVWLNTDNTPSVTPPTSTSMTTPFSKLIFNNSEQNWEKRLNQDTLKTTWPKNEKSTILNVNTPLYLYT